MELTERVKRAREYEEQIYGELRDDPINLDALFDAMVKTVHFHYVGYEQKQQYFTPAEYHTYIYSHYRYQSLTVEMLVRSFHQFVGDMHDRHLRFSCDDWIDYRNVAATYRVRAYEDALYVTRADEGSGLKTGDQILKVQGMTPERIRRLTRHHCFYSREKERELWGGYLRMARSLTVEHTDGTRETIEVPAVLASEDPRSVQARYPVFFRELENKNGAGRSDVYLKVGRMDREALHALLDAHRTQVEHAGKLILDLRCCIGGDEDALWELFPYLVSKETKLKQLIADEGSYVLCTVQNCDARLAQLKAYQARQEDLPFLQEEMDFYREHRGKGLVYREAPQMEDEVIVPAPRAPEQVILLTDTFCEDEGEQFVAMAQRCGRKVRTIGRPTMGTLDYDDPIRLQIHPHMTLSYPIRMTKAAFEGRGISERGLPVEQYIPWSPREIKEDVILKAAMSWSFFDK